MDKDAKQWYRDKTGWVDADENRIDGYLVSQHEGVENVYLVSSRLPTTKTQTDRSRLADRPVARVLVMHVGFVLLTK